MDLTQALDSGGFLVALPLAFVGGVMMGLNPCCLALFPAAAAACSAGACAADKPRFEGGSALAFVLGTATATTALGVAAALAGHTLDGLGGWVRYAVAAVPIVMGLQLLGWVKLPMPRGAALAARGAGAPAAFANGLLLSLVIGPCGTPALAAILSYAAYRGSVAFGALLLFLYGVGSGLPLIVAGIASGRLTGWLARSPARAWTERVAGLLMVGTGVFLVLRAH